MMMSKIAAADVVDQAGDIVDAAKGQTHVVVRKTFEEEGHTQENDCKI